MNIWQIYEIEKQRIKEQNLSPAEYEREIRKLTERLGI